MSDLRDRAVEAMKAEYERHFDEDMIDGDWNSDELAMHMFDALLDFLDSNADDWRSSIRGYPAFAGGYIPKGFSVSVSGIPVEWWLASLREDT